MVHFGTSEKMIKISGKVNQPNIENGFNIHHQILIKFCFY